MMVAAIIRVRHIMRVLRVAAAAGSLVGVTLPRAASGQSRTRSGRSAAASRVPAMQVDSTCRTARIPFPDVDAKGDTVSLLVDVVFRGPNDSTTSVPRPPISGLPRFGPTPEQVRSVEALGARVVYRFVLPGVRARIAAAKLRERIPVAEYLITVPEPRRHDVEIVVTYPYWPDDRTAAGNRAIDAREREFEKTLGGRMLEPFAERAAYLAVIPDQGLRKLLTTHRGTSAEWTPSGCLAARYEQP